MSRELEKMMPKWYVSWEWFDGKDWHEDYCFVHAAFTILAAIRGMQTLTDLLEVQSSIREIRNFSVIPWEEGKDVYTSDMVPANG